jgi:hypothetical protein
LSIEPTTGIVVSALVVSAAFCVAGALRWRNKLDYRLGQATWDLSQSWASNLAAVGSILGTLVAVSGALPQADLTLTAIVLSVFFAALVILGPLTYTALQAAIGPDGTVLEGAVWAFLVSSGLTLWAAIGEAETAAAFFVNLPLKLPQAIVWLFVAVVGLAVLMLLRYGWLSMGVIVKLAEPKVAAADRKVPLESWRLI